MTASTWPTRPRTFARDSNYWGTSLTSYLPPCVNITCKSLQLRGGEGVALAADHHMNDCGEGKERNCFHIFIALFFLLSFCVIYKIEFINKLRHWCYIFSNIKGTIKFLQADITGCLSTLSLSSPFLFSLQLLPPTQYTCKKLPTPNPDPFLC